MPEEQTKIKRKRCPKLLRWTLRTVLSLLLIVMAAAGSLYIPGVLDRVLEKFSPSIEESSGLRISAEHIRLSFPLTLKVENLLILDMTAGGDTMVSAGNGRLSVNPPALLGGNLKLNDSELRRVTYKMGGRDSMYLSARVDRAHLSGSIRLNFSDISLDHAVIDGGRVHVVIGPDTTSPSKEKSAPLLLKLRDVELNNVLYAMYMSASNDTIAAAIARGKITDGTILAADTVEISAPDIAVALDSALYGTKGAEPMPGFDMNWLTLRDATLDISDFNMRGTALTLPIKKLSVRDIAGVPLEAHGTFAMDSAMIAARGFELLLNGRSRITADAEMGLDTLTPAPVRLDLSTRLYTPTIAKLFPAAIPLIAALPADVPLTLRAIASGTMDDIKADTLAAAMPGIFYLRGAGTAANFTGENPLTLDAELNGKVTDPRPLNPLMPEGTKLPPLDLRAIAKARGGNYAADVTATTSSGRLALNGTLRGTAPSYDVGLQADDFPVAAFMPGLGVGTVSARVKATGRGLNPLRPGAEFGVTAQVSGADYNGHHLSGIELTAALKQSELTARMASQAPAARFDIDLAAKLSPRSVEWRLDSDIRRLDLHALGLSDSVMNATLLLASQGYASVKLDSISGDVIARNVRVGYGADTYRADSLALTANTGRTTSVTLGNNTLHLAFDSGQSIDSVAARFSSAATLASQMIARKDFMADSLVAAMPPFELNVTASQGNLAEQFLASSGIRFRHLTLNAVRDSTLRASARIVRIKAGEDLNIDTISARMGTGANRLFLDLDMDNAPGTFDQFAHVCFKGAVRGNQGRFFVEQKDIQGQTGYKLGFLATVTDSISGIQLTPYDPIIAYKHWKINEDNYLAVYPAHKRIYANLDASGADSRIQLLTTKSEASDTTDTPNQLTLRVSDIHIQDWLEINPWAPPIAGDASADLTLHFNDDEVSGSGTASLHGFTYGKRRVGDIDLDLDVATGFGGAVHANVGMNVDGRRVFTALGAVNDTTQASPLNMYVRLRQFPLSIANPFLPQSTAQLSGTLNGHMAATGTSDSISLNGSLRFADAAVAVGMMGSTFRLDSVDIPVDTNIVRFNDFDIFGANGNPLKVNGSVDITRLSDPGINLSMTARNMQFVNSRKGKGIDLFGKGYLDLDATVKGNLDFLNVNANLAILPQTNLTYQMSEAAAMAGLQPDEDVVRFVNFADTAQVQQADSIAPSGTLMAIAALLDIRQGSQFTVNLSADGTDRAQIKGQGVLDYTSNPALPDGRLTGRFTIDGGNFRYSLPVISTVDFNLTRGSYVAFTGPVLNPQLNIQATQTKKANVTTEGQNSRLINFIVGLSATGTLERMDVAFDLSTKDDITVENELQAMSATQRANKAMNLMLYGTYASGNTSATANLSGLYGFLTSQLNSWAANSIKGVDVSFGVDQFDRTYQGAKSTTTQYSYKVSKSLFNDRFKIIVGGNYSTDADAEENFAQNLISDISFEYMLNQSGSMYVRLFRHTGFESILEGEVTQTGVGFVVRRKVRKLADIFNFKKAAKQ